MCAGVTGRLLLQARVVQGGGGKSSGLEQTSAAKGQGSGDDVPDGALKPKLSVAQ